MTEKENFEKRVGTTLCGKWKLERLLGVGGMAAVYVGVHKIGRRDAIKILHPEVARSKDLRGRFEQEAQAVNRFKHPGAVEIRDIDVTDDGAPFLVMELLEGESLAERARRMNGLPEDEVLRLVDELLDVLAAAHAEGIIHRDIKLDNLFIQTDGGLKVLDFGIARVRDSAMKTRTGATLGTVAYMPPEQVKGQDVDPRADLFAVGATMFRVLAKRRLHDALSESDLLVRMATTPPPLILSVCATVRPDIALIVDRALAFQRERRYPDALAMQADVRAVRAGRPPPFASERLAAGDPPNEVAPVGSAALRPARPPRTIPDEAAEAPTVAPGVPNVSAARAHGTRVEAAVPSFTAPVTVAAPPASRLAPPAPPPALSPADEPPPSTAWPNMGPVARGLGAAPPAVAAAPTQAFGAPPAAPPLGVPAAPPSLGNTSPSLGSASPSFGGPAAAPSLGNTSPSQGGLAAAPPSFGVPAAAPSLGNTSPSLGGLAAAPPSFGGPAAAPPSFGGPAAPAASFGAPAAPAPSFGAAASAPGAIGGAGPASAGALSMPLSSGTASASRRSDGFMLAVIGAVVVLVGVGIGVAWALRNSSDAPPLAPSSSPDGPSAPASASGAGPVRVPPSDAPTAPAAPAVPDPPHAAPPDSPPQAPPRAPPPPPPPPPQPKKAPHVHHR